jgi:hypothetical protein
VSEKIQRIKNFLLQSPLPRVKLVANVVLHPIFLFIVISRSRFYPCDCRARRLSSVRKDEHRSSLIFSNLNWHSRERLSGDRHCIQTLHTRLAHLQDKGILHDFRIPQQSRRDKRTSGKVHAVCNGNSLQTFPYRFHLQGARIQEMDSWFCPHLVFMSFV